MTTLEQAQLDALGIARAITEHRYSEADQVLNQLNPDEKNWLLVASLTLLASIIEGNADGFGQTPAQLYDEIILPHKK